MDEAGLLAAIAAAPDENGPRLVLADWLQLRGDAWGELIVLGCELERRIDHALVERYNELYATRFPTGAFERTCDRGFFTDIESDDLATAVGPEYALLRTASLRDAVPASLRALARWPLLPQLASLHLGAKSNIVDLGAHVPPVFAAARGLEALDLMSMDVARDDIDAMLAQPHAAKLRRLAIAANRHLEDRLDGIAWPELDELELSACGLVSDDVAALLKSEALPALHRLDLTFNLIGDSGAAALASTRFTRLRTLQLQGTSIGTSGIAELVAAEPLQRLARLAIGGSSEQDIDEALPMLASAFPELNALELFSQFPMPHLPSVARPLEELALHFATYDAGTLARLLAHPALRSLRYLELDAYSETDSGDAIAEVLATADLPDLMELRLIDCGTTERGARALAEAVHLPRSLALMILGRGEDIGGAVEALQARFVSVTT